MNYIMLGCAGFLIVHLFDVVSLKKWPLIKPLTWFTGNVLLLYAIASLALRHDGLVLPSWSVWLGWELLVLSCPVFLYSLFGNLPFRKTYVASGVNDRLITSGLYSLVRHPGVFWFSTTLISVAVVSTSASLFVAAPVFILMDIVLVIVQDKYFFIRMFRGYSDYQHTTPMLIPNRQSIRTFLNSLNNNLEIR